MYNQEEQQALLEHFRTNLEKTMLQLPPEASIENHRFYLAGMVDSLAELGIIEEQTREILYEEYCM